MSRVLRFPYRTLAELLEDERRLVSALEAIRAEIARAEGQHGRPRFPRCACALCIVERARGERP